MGFQQIRSSDAITHVKDATNITLHILKVSRHIDLCGIQRTIVLCEDMLNRQMYYVLNTGRHITLTGIMSHLQEYTLSRLAHAV